MKALLKTILLQCFDIVDVLVIERIKCDDEGVPVEEREGGRECRGEHAKGC